MWFGLPVMLIISWAKAIVAVTGASGPLAAMPAMVAAACMP